MMIDFIYRLNDALPIWSSDSKWSLKQIAEATDTSIPHVLQYLSEGLCKEIDVSGSISVDEATEAILLLSKKIQPEIEERERLLAERREEAIRQYYRITDKAQQMQIDQRWHTAFRTLSYFAGENESDLPQEILINLCSEVVRCGIKAKANIQELGQWLQRGVAVALSLHSQEGMRECLDLLEAYSDVFLNDDSGKGPLIVGNLLAILEEPCARFELWQEYKSLVESLYPAN